MGLMYGGKVSFKTDKEQILKIYENFFTRYDEQEDMFFNSGSDVFDIKYNEGNSEIELYCNAKNHGPFHYGIYDGWKDPTNNEILIYSKMLYGPVIEKINEIGIKMDCCQKAEIWMEKGGNRPVFFTKININDFKKLFSSIDEVKNIKKIINSMQKNTLFKLKNATRVFAISKSKKNEIFISKNISPNKYDVNVTFPAIKNKTLREYKKHIKDIFFDKEKATKIYNIQRRRIDELVKNGYLEIKNNKYIITEEGKEAIKNIDSPWKFTFYDANVVFKYIKEHAGLLELENLEAKRKFNYLKKRINNNIKQGYIEKDENNYYSITEKGKKAAIEIERKIIKQYI